jgi:hypothetical protein
MYIVFHFHSDIFCVFTIHYLYICIILYFTIATDVNKQTTYNVPENERILINTGDIIGW